MIAPKEHPSNPDQLMAQALGVCWHPPTSDRWPCTARPEPGTVDGDGWAAPETHADHPLHPCRGNPMTTTPAVTDRTGASDQEFADRVAAFEGAPAAPESFDPIAALRRVEALAVAVERGQVGPLTQDLVAFLIRVAVTDSVAALAPQAGEER